MSIKVDWDAIYGRSWSAHADMLNAASQLENTAAKLRRSAAELHAQLDPRDKQDPNP